MAQYFVEVVTNVYTGSDPHVREFSYTDRVRIRAVDFSDAEWIVDGFERPGGHWSIERHCEIVVAVRFHDKIHYIPVSELEEFKNVLESTLTDVFDNGGNIKTSRRERVIPRLRLKPRSQEERNPNDPDDPDRSAMA